VLVCVRTYVLQAHQPDFLSFFCLPELLAYLYGGRQPLQGSTVVTEGAAVATVVVVVTVVRGYMQESADSISCAHQQILFYLLLLPMYA
jgi:hypothetical protein